MLKSHTKGKKHKQNSRYKEKVSFYIKLQRKEVLEKMILDLEKSLTSSPKILYEPWLMFFHISFLCILDLLVVRKVKRNAWP